MKFYKCIRKGNADFEINTTKVIEEGEHFWIIRGKPLGRDDGYLAIYKKKQIGEGIWGWYKTPEEAIHAQRVHISACREESARGVALRDREILELRRMLEQDPHKRRD